MIVSALSSRQSPKLTNWYLDDHDLVRNGMDAAFAMAAAASTALRQNPVDGPVRDLVSTLFGRDIPPGIALVSSKFYLLISRS